MAIPYQEVLARESEQFREAVEQRAAELIAEELNLREMRRLRKLTQARLSRKLKIGQEGISRIEKRGDLYLSTLRNYVEGVGGRLSLVVEFPDRAPIRLAGLGEPNAGKPQKPVPKKARGTTKSRSKTRRVA
jgi:DNA-binding XRE family transcriptional regulator